MQRPTGADDQKPRRLYYESLLAMVRNSVGSRLFNTFYVQLSDGTTIDAFDDGKASCAAFVSGLLVMAGKLDGFHGTVDQTVAGLEKTQWGQLSSVQLQTVKPLDVLVWEAVQLEGTDYRHIGFAIGEMAGLSALRTCSGG